MEYKMKKRKQKKQIPLSKGFHSLEWYYEEIAKAYFDDTPSVIELFQNNQAKKFIGQYFEKERKNPKIHYCIDRITSFRAIHTVSSFLLGLALRNHLHFDTRSWRRLPGETSPNGSFELFWSWICLFHDIGYYYEVNSEQFAKCKTMPELIKTLKIKYNLLDESCCRELIQNYYAMRINSDAPKVDHGIIGAMLLYDALMNLSECTEIYSEIKNYKSFYAKICDTIAKHNMWRATNMTIDHYIKFELFELIPDNDLHHKVYYKNDPLLFLLSLVDTIDPIKYFCRDNRYRNSISTTDVLENVYLQFLDYSGVKQLSITYDASAFDDYAKEIADQETGLSSWLGTHIRLSDTKGKNPKLSIVIDLNDIAIVKRSGA